MGVKKISDLDQASTLFDGCCFPMVQNGDTKRVTFQTMRQMVADSEEMAAKLNGKVNVENGKGLSTNDFTTAEKMKLQSVGMNANENVIEKIFLNGALQTILNKSIYLEIAGGGSVEGVTINGESIVDENNIAKIPFASTTNFGVLKLGNGAELSSTNAIMSKKLSLANYATANDNTFISKGTLENVLDDRIGAIDALIGNGVIE